MQMEAFSNSPTMMTSPYGGTLSYTFTKNTSTHSTSTPRSSMLDTRIWCRLPQPILDRVLAFFPAPAFFRARSVCKRWYGLLYSPSFLQMYLHVIPRERHWFIFFNHNPLKTHIYSKPSRNDVVSAESYLFDPYSLTWSRLSFPLIPAGFSPAASSGGLLCWVSDEAGPKSLFLDNPLHATGYNNSYSVTQLPPTIKPRLFPSIGLAVSSDYWSSLDVVVAGDDMVSPYAVKNLTTETFRVDTRGIRAWGQGPTSPLPRLCSLESRHMIYSHSLSKFFCMNYSPFGVLCYDVATSEWSKIQAPMRRFLRSPSLVEGRGEVVMVAAVEKSKLNVPRSLRIWRLCGAQWVETERMPQQMYSQFEDAERRSGGGCSKMSGFDCVGHGEFIVITIRGADNKAAVLFDARRKSWMWMPPCPFLCVGAQLHGFAYEPRLATPVTGLLDHHFALP